MKFGKRLKQQIQETLPEWKDKFVSYKELKKLVRLISSENGVSSEFGKPESEFVCLLNHQIDKFNSFFMEKEEDFIIRHKELQQRIQRVQNTWVSNGSHYALELLYKEEMGKIRKDIVNFHGEMVLLINYSNINYTGLAKILKKYDKRTGSLLRLPFIKKVVEQPFFTTDLISKLIKELETTIDAIFHGSSVHDDDDDDDKAQVEEDGMMKEKEKNNEEILVLGEGIFRNTVAALLTMQEIRSGSSTFSQLSLPPLDLLDSQLMGSFKFSSHIPNL